MLIALNAYEFSAIGSVIGINRTAWAVCLIPFFWTFWDTGSHTQFCCNSFFLTKEKRAPTEVRHSSLALHRYYTTFPAWCQPFFGILGLIALRFPPRMRGNGKGERKKKPARRRKKAKGKNDLKRRVQFRVCPKLRVFLPFGGRSEAEAEAKKTFTGFFALRGRLGEPTKRYD